MKGKGLIVGKTRGSWAGEGKGLKAQITLTDVGPLRMIFFL